MSRLCGGSPALPCSVVSKCWSLNDSKELTGHKVHAEQFGGCGDSLSAVLSFRRRFISLYEL